MISPKARAVMKLVPKPEFPDSPLPTKYEWGDEVTKLLVRGLHTDLVKEGPPVGASCGTESFPPWPLWRRQDGICPHGWGRERDPGSRKCKPHLELASKATWYNRSCFGDGTLFLPALSVVCGHKSLGHSGPSLSLCAVETTASASH